VSSRADPSVPRDISAAEESRRYTGLQSEQRILSWE